MNTLDQSQKTLVVGFGLMLVGSVIFAAQFVSIGWLVMPLLATLFLALGIVTKESGWFIPTGILYGLSGGIWLVEHVVQGNNEREGGTFMLAFGVGWLLVAVLARVFRTQPQDWALIVSGVFAVIGLAAFGPEYVGVFGDIAVWVLRGAGYAGPLALVGWGGWLLLHRRQPSNKS